MLERCFARPQTVDRIRSSWLGPPIERYVTWLLARSYALRDVLHRVPILMHFGAYAQVQGATEYAELPAHLEGFVEHWLHRPDDRRAMGPPRPRLAREVRGPIEQMLRLVVPGFVGHTRRRYDGWPFAAAVPGFFGYLRESAGCATRPLRTTPTICAASRHT
jgi:integrase/recombinase XerD